MAARRLSWRRASLRARLTTGAAAIIALLLVSSAFLALELLHANTLNSVDEAAGQRVNDLITLSGNIGRWPDPLPSAAGERVTVIAATGLGLTELEMATLRRVLLIACPLVLVLGVVSSWLLVGRSLRPVEAMRVQVAEISTQALDQRVPQPAGDDELGRLVGNLLDNGLRWADRRVAVHLRAHDG